jgi:hypothetical protein
MSAPDLASRIDSAFESASTWIAGAGVLRAQGDEPVPELVPFVNAFEYDLVDHQRTDRREHFGPFAPLIEWQGGTYPPPLSEVAGEWLNRWATVAEASSSSAVRSRLCDLLWVARAGKTPHLWARHAIDDYLGQSERWSDLQAADCLVRALELAREINDQERCRHVITRLLAHISVSLEDEEWKPGVPLRSVAAILELPPDDQPVEIDALLDRALARYADDSWITESILEMQVKRRRGDADAVRELRSQEVERWREAALAGDGLLRFAHLQHALELARAYGLNERADEIRRELQGIAPEDLGLKKISASASVAADAIEEMIEGLVVGSWQEGLARLGSFGPPSGDFESNAETVRHLMKQHPLQFLFQRVILGPENTVLKRPANEQEQFAAELARYEQQRALFWGSVAVEVLSRIRDRQEAPRDEELVQFFTTTLIAPEPARAFARALRLFWDGRPDESAHLITPRIEAVLRELARQSGLVVIREPINDRPGGVRTLGDLLRDLEGRFDESWRRYLWNLLAEPLGLNARNLISHGLIGEVSTPLAALLLHVACFLRLLVEGPSQEIHA